MRIPDSYLRSSYMRSLNNTKNSLAEVQYKLTTQRNVNKPSDNPLSNSRILRLQNQLGNINTYQTNITYGQSMIDSSTSSLQNMQDIINDVNVELTNLNSAVIGDDYTTFADSIDGSLDLILSLANSEFNGQYNFGGSENGSRPFQYDEANGRVTTPNYIGGSKKVRISESIKQEFNIPGRDLFQSVLTQKGNLDSRLDVGIAQDSSSKVYDAEGNEYTLNMTYTKTADNEYQLTYDVVDSDAVTVSSETVTDIKFDATTGKFASVGDEKFGEIKVTVPGNKIDFAIDVSKLKISESDKELNESLNQKADIFNTLISIRDGLMDGIKPTDEQVQLVKDFNQHLINHTTSAGGISNKLTSAEIVLGNRETEVTELLSIEQDVNVARALIDLETTQYALDLTYKISSMILPKSLLDYL
ncbi:MAG: flagellar hook-associated protein 3 [Ignavibacteriae bacterium]|nr:flagellar hook-associated protein 3 [Ignavibacteriota bacterium]